MFFDIFGPFILLLLLILFVIIAAARARTRRLNRLETRLNELADRVKRLGQSVRQIETRKAPAEKAVETAPAPEAAEKPALEEVPTPALARMAAEVGPAAPVGEKAAAKREEVKPPPAAAGRLVSEPEILAERVETAKAAPPAVERPSPRPRAAARPSGRFAEPLAKLSKAMPRRGMTLSEWEALVGGNWLNKLGIVVFVVGVALLLGYSLRYFGPAGKIATGVATALTLLATGLLLERREKYSTFAKPVIGGGWAILYFTAFAAYNVQASKIIDQPAIALLAMAAVAAGMILHSFRYREQVVTAIAYGLGYLAIVISPLTGFSLIAIALLAASLIVVLQRMPWFHLAIVAEVGTYVGHFMWMAQSTAEPTAQGLWFNTAVLSLYWALFTILLFVKRKERAGGDGLLLAVSVGNATGFLALGGWAIWASFPDNLYLLTGGTTFAYVALSYLIWREQRQQLFLFSASMAVILAAVTVPFAGRGWPAFDREWLALYWAAEAGVVVTLGFRLRQIVLRIESYLLCLASLVALAAINLGSSTEGRHLLVWVSVVPVILFFFYMFEKLKKAAGHGDVLAEARTLGIVLGYAATAILALLLWREMPRDLIGLIWLGVGLLFFETGLRTNRPHLRGQAYVLAALAILAFAFINILSTARGSAVEVGWSIWAIVTPGIAALYYLYGRLFVQANTDKLTSSETDVLDASSTAASALLAALLWHELPSEIVGLGWLLSGLALFEVGLRIGSLPLRMQAYALAAIAAAAFFLIDLYSVAGPVAEDFVASRWVILLPAVLVYYYVYWRLRRHADTGTLHAVELARAELASIIATALLAVLFWRELPSVAVALAWGVLGLALFEIGASAALPTLRLQGHVLLGAAFVRLFMANFTSTTDTFGISHRVITVTPLIAMAYFLFARLRQLFAVGLTTVRERQLDIAYSYAGAILLVVLARFEFGRAYTVIAWAPLMLVFLAIGVLRNERDFRYQSYILAILAFARSWATNMYLTGSFFGIPERFATMTPMVLAFLVAALLCIRKRAGYVDQVPTAWAKSRTQKALRSLDVHSNTLFSLLGPTLVAILLLNEVSGNVLTMAWSIEGFLVLTLGFAVVERSFRLFGLGLLAVCVAKLIVVDLEGVETIYRILSYIVLGLLLLSASFVYTRYRDTIKRYL